MEGSGNRLDLLAVGRASVDLYGEQIGGRLEGMGSFAKYVGGSPTNTAIGGARLGLRTALLTRVGDDHFGRFIREELAREQVDTRAVQTDPSRLTALAVLGIRDQERFPLIFYRENCADMALSIDELDLDLVRSASAVLINGTHLSRPDIFAFTRHVAEAARAAGRKVVFDIDYRPVLWGLAPQDMGENRFVADAAVTGKLQQVLSLCDLVVGTEEEFRILGGAEDTVAALKNVRAVSKAILVCKLGDRGCVAFDGPVGERLADGLMSPGFAVEVFNVLGAGDAFMAGFLRGWLRGEPLEACCRYANGCGALVVSRHGCAPAMPSWFELEWFLSATSPPLRLRDDRDLEHLHWATTRPRLEREMMVLAMDHRTQLADLARELGVPDERVRRFKSLSLSVLNEVAQGDLGFGVILDSHYGARALESAADTPYWIARPIELPGSRPLQFEGSPDVGMELREWPQIHTVKCLVIYRADDPDDLKAEQNAQLVRLFDACRKTRRELVLEVIVSQTGPVGVDTTAKAMAEVYALGVKPDWWKLEPATDAAVWAHVDEVIAKHDSWCRGILLLGLSAPEEALMASFEAVAGSKFVRGFAVGRTIFFEIARRWLEGGLNDREAVQEMASRLRRLVDAWRTMRAKSRASPRTN